MLGFYIFQFIPLLVVEGIVLWRMKWGSLPRSMFDSLMMNFASFLGLILGLGPYIAGYGNWGLALFGTYSIMVEGTVLLLLERHPPRTVFISVVLANFAGCLFLDCSVWLDQIPWHQILPHAATIISAGASH